MEESAEKRFLPTYHLPNIGRVQVSHLRELAEVERPHLNPLLPERVLSKNTSELFVYDKVHDGDDLLRVLHELVVESLRRGELFHVLAVNVDVQHLRDARNMIMEYDDVTN